MSAVSHIYLSPSRPGEYAREKCHKRMISRNRTPASGMSTSLGWGTGQACDTPNNDWESTYRDFFDTYADQPSYRAHVLAVSIQYHFSGFAVRQPSICRTFR